MIGDKKGTPVNVPVICVNDKDRPAEVPTSKWVTEGDKYTIVEFVRLNRLGGKMAVRLAEIDLSDCFPYQFFLADRFGIPVSTEKEAKDEIDQTLEKILEDAEKEYKEVAV